MSTSPSNSNMGNTESCWKAVATREKNPRSWLAVFGIATVVGMMGVLSAMSASPSQRKYLFDRRLQFKWVGSCSGGDECERQCDVNATCDTDTCRGACKSQADARDCGCTNTADACWNRDCEAQCMGDAYCETEDCQIACGRSPALQEACGCGSTPTFTPSERPTVAPSALPTPPPTCFKQACADECTEDPACEKGSVCGDTCVDRARALGCGCGPEHVCFTDSCNDECQLDPLCESQACQEACVTEENTLACCGCIKPECEAQCHQDFQCSTSDCQEACGSPAMQVACGCGDACSNTDCEAKCDQDPTCKTQDCKDACGPDQEACGCTKPHPKCFKPACAQECREDIVCEKGSVCGSICTFRFRALECGCGDSEKCFNYACENECQVDPHCETQACKDICVTADNTLACGCTKKCFNSRQELRDAVDKFMQGGQADMEELEGTYGAIGIWCVSEIQDFSDLLNAADRNPLASSFNSDISAWNVSKAFTMYRMFRDATDFNQDLSSWNTSSVKNMSAMFHDANSFNQDLSSWDVSKVSRMETMFLLAGSFNQSLCSWGIKLPPNAILGGMFTQATSCPTQAIPNLNASPPGPFCHVCN
jgi:surface protein